MHTNQRAARPEMVGRQKTAQHQYRHANVPAKHYSCFALSDDFKAGLFLGIAISALVFSVVLFTWVIPTMDGAVAMAKQAAGL